MKLSPDMLTDAILLLDWFCGICTVFLLAELIVSCVKYLINRKLLNLKRFCSFREH